jgi:hypothetical protein
MKTLLGHELPNSFMLVDRFGPSGWIYRYKSGMKIIETTSPVPDSDQEWHHLSMSYPTKLPTYDEMKLMKAIFVGDAYTSMQFFPSKSRHVNIHDYCLHLWTPLDYDVTPDFGKEGTI